jgi:hydrogenase maturation protease
VIARAMPERAPIAIIGVGNVLLGDDGFGPSVIRRLERRWCWPADVELVDVGTGGLELLHHLLDREQVVLIDAVAPVPQQAAGQLRVLDTKTLLADAARPGFAAPHEPSIRSTLQLAALTQRLPRHVSLHGAAPRSTAVGAALSAAMQRAVVQTARAVVQELAACGVHARRQASYPTTRFMPA